MSQIIPQLFVIFRQDQPGQQILVFVVDAWRKIHTPPKIEIKSISSQKCRLFWRPYRCLNARRLFRKKDGKGIKVSELKDNYSLKIRVFGLVI